MQSLNQSKSKNNMYQFETNSRSNGPNGREQHRVNMRGDVYALNTNGQVSSFRYANQDTSFSFAYDNRGNLEAISSSAGWTWAKSETEDFSGWVVRNYFDRWQVSTDEVGEVYVNQSGIHTTKNNLSAMALPDLALQ
ncbi:MAG TPA: hypothetical protein V6C86_15245 [Oculatellaceae cyanobacterium]